MIELMTWILDLLGLNYSEVDTTAEMGGYSDPHG